jgi:hypothetical protein
MELMLFNGYVIICWTRLRPDVFDTLLVLSMMLFVVPYIVALNYILGHETQP